MCQAEVDHKIAGTSGVMQILGNLRLNITKLATPALVTVTINVDGMEEAGETRKRFNSPVMTQACQISGSCNVSVCVMRRESHRRSQCHVGTRLGAWGDVTAGINITSRQRDKRT
jgi:hypothetical protein